MFDHELGVDGRQFDGTVFSLFAPKETVDHRNQELSGDSTVPGRVRVEIIGHKGNLVLVKLPQETFQNGAFITVSPDQLETAAPGQRV
jgi:hypothetical protein